MDLHAAVLVPDEHRLHLRKLSRDMYVLREILDFKELLSGLLDSPTAIQVSPRFYFCVLMRHAFQQADLSDPDLADYMTNKPNGKDMPPQVPDVDVVGLPRESRRQ